MKLFDAHLHFFSRDFFDALAIAAASRTDGSPEALLAAAAARAGIELPPADPVDHLQRWLAQMENHGVDRAILFASVPEEANAVRTAVLDADDRLIPFTAVNPVSPGAPLFARRALQEMGFRGILLFPSLHHYDLTDEACRPVLEEARTARAVVVVHCGILRIPVRDLLGLPPVYDMRYSSPLGVIPAANLFPEIPFVIPHFGAGLFREALIAGSQCPNIFVDTAGSNSWMETQPGDLELADVFRMALRVYGSHRILFGTDSTTFPRGWRNDVYCAQSAALERLRISIPERNRIFGENLGQILGLHT